MNHIIARAKERISPDIPPDILTDLQLALSDPERWSDYIEPVIDASAGAKLWRFRTVHGIFYAVAKGCHPVTIYTQDQMRAKKRIAKATRNRPAWFDPRKAKRA